MRYQPIYNPANWYWIIGAESKVYSSKSNTLVAATDADYVAWTETGNVPTQIANEVELWQVLRTSLPQQFPAWLFNGETFVQPAINNYTPDQISGYAANVRWQKETGGLVFTPVSGPSQGIAFTVVTTRDARSAIDAAAITASKTAEWTTQWKDADGVFHPVDQATISQMQLEVQAFVEACFATEQSCQSFTTLGQVDDAFENMQP